MKAVRSRADTNLVVNGGFETGDLTGWIHPDSVPVVLDTFPHSGNYEADWGNNPPDTTISQLIPTTDGATYDINYWLRIFTSGDAHVNHFESSFGGQVLQDSNNLTDTGFQLYSYSFVATANQELLQFGASNTSQASVLDDVSVVETVAPASTPEPGAFAILSVLGLCCTALILKRR